MHGQFMGFEYLLRVRLDDLKVTAFLTAENGNMCLPWSKFGGNTFNNHFIWSECGTILMTASGKTYAFRLD